MLFEFYGLKNDIFDKKENIGYCKRTFLVTFCNVFVTTQMGIIFCIKRMVIWKRNHIQSGITVF